MSPSPPEPIRLVIQRVSGAAPGSVSYRMVVYPERKGLRLKPAHLSTREDLVARLRQALPDFNPQSLRPESEATQVLFAATLPLTNLQLVQLGVAELVEGA